MQDRVIAPYAAQADAWRVVLGVDTAHARVSSRRPVLEPVAARVVGVHECLPPPSDLPVGLVAEAEGENATAEPFGADRDNEVEQVFAFGLDHAGSPPVLRHEVRLESVNLRACVLSPTHGR